MCQFRFSLSVSLSVSRDLFVFVLFCRAFFLRLSLMQILALVLLSFDHFEGSFHFWALLWGLVLRPFSTCTSLMSFSPFSRFLWLLSLLVATSFFLFFFSVLFCLGLLSLFRVRHFRFVFLSSTQIFAYWFCSHQVAEHGSIHCLAFSARACSLAFLCLAILFLAICRVAFLIYWFVFLGLVFRLFSL